MNQKQHICAVLDAVRARSNPVEYFRNMDLYDKLDACKMLGHDLRCVLPDGSVVASPQFTWSMDGQYITLTLSKPTE